MRIRPEKETSARKELNSNETENTKCRFNNAVDVISEKIGEEPPHYLTEFEQYKQDEYERWLKQEERRKQEIRERYKPLKLLETKELVSENIWQTTQRKVLILFRLVSSESTWHTLELMSTRN